MFGLKLGLPRGSSKKTSAPPKSPTPASGLSPIASAVVLAAGAGVAFWWWTQWARGRAESEADPSTTDLTEPDPPSPKDLDSSVR
jgi:hypothetical protein